MEGMELLWIDKNSRWKWRWNMNNSPEHHGVNVYKFEHRVLLDCFIMQQWWMTFRPCSVHQWTYILTYSAWQLWACYWLLWHWNPESQSRHLKTNFMATVKENIMALIMANILHLITSEGKVTQMGNLAFIFRVNMV